MALDTRARNRSQLFSLLKNQNLADRQISDPKRTRPRSISSEEATRIQDLAVRSWQAPDWPETHPRT